jgi:hypothetical protein
MALNNHSLLFLMILCYPGQVSSLSDSSQSPWSSILRLLDQAFQCDRGSIPRGQVAVHKYLSSLYLCHICI